MPVVETDALVLKTYSLSDADKIAVFLTRDHGVVRGVAKGAKRLTSHFGSGLEPCSFIRLSYFQKEQNELVSIRGADLNQSYFNLVSSPSYLQRFSYMAELLSEFVPQGEPNERVFKMMQVCLDTLSLDPESLDPVTMYFELWLLKLGGYLPDWSVCGDCERVIPEREEASLQANSRLLCRNCQKAKGAWNITRGEREVYGLAQKVGPGVFVERVGADGVRNARSVSKVLRRIISGILGKDIDEERMMQAKY